MRILITGAGGMIGAKLTSHLVSQGQLNKAAIEALDLADVVPVKSPANFSGGGQASAGDLSEPDVARRLIAPRPDVIFHLAAVVSGEAEANYEKGYRVNFDGTRNLLEAIRAEGLERPYRPRVVFCSSLAVFGSPLPDVLEDDCLTAPLTSYGTQKVMGELLVNDLSRRGIIDGVSIRLPNICVRPGKPNKAASGFFSGIIREPLSGMEAILPVSDDVRGWHASPRAAVGFLVQAATVDLSSLGSRRALNMPGLSVSVGEQIEALREVAGESAVKLIRRQADPLVGHIIGGWPKAFNAARAQALGFQAESSFQEIIRIYMQDELAA